MRTLSIATLVLVIVGAACRSSVANENVFGGLDTECLDGPRQPGSL